MNTRYSRLLSALLRAKSTHKYCPVSNLTRLLKQNPFSEADRVNNQAVGATTQGITLHGIDNSPAQNSALLALAHLRAGHQTVNTQRHLAPHLPQLEDQPNSAHNAVADSH
jgi:hypothetical protein